MTMNQDLKKRLQQQAKRMQQAEKDQPTLIGQTVYIGTLGLMFVLPPVVGAYVGYWLDNQFSGYSVRWTISLIILGVIVGGINVYLFIKE